MKKLIVFLSGMLFAYTVTNTKTYYKNIRPSMLKANLEIIITKKTLNGLINLLNENVNRLKPLCQNTSYSFTPVYKYINKKEIFENYKAYINTECLFKTSEIKTFSSMLNTIKKAKVKLTHLNFTVTEKESKTAINALKTKAYTDIQKEAKNLSKKLNRKCFVKNIKFTSSQNIKRFYTLKTYSSLPVPENNKKISIMADYQIECY
ncbi:SIMPL domain-containing protein [Nautilia sp.]